MFYKKGVLRNFTKFTGKHLCQSLFFNKVAVLSTSTLLKKRPWHSCFPVNFEKFLRTPFLTKHLRWLHLKMRFFTSFHCTKKWSFRSRISSVNVTKSGLVTFTPEILNGKLHFLCTVWYNMIRWSSQKFPPKKLLFSQFKVC